jgi:hypothetical protein
LFDVIVEEPFNNEHFYRADVYTPARLFWEDLL